MKFDKKELQVIAVALNFMINMGLINSHLKKLALNILAKINK